MSKRYLVTRAIDEEFEDAGGFVLKAEPGNEITLDDDMAEAVNRAHPGSLMEMSPKTEHNVNPDEDVS